MPDLEVGQYECQRESLLQKKVDLKKDPNARDLYGNKCLG